MLPLHRHVVKRTLPLYKANLATTRFSPNSTYHYRTMSSKPSFHITPARTPKDLEDTRSLFLAYAKSLNINLSFQDFDTELATLPGKYAPPAGDILLARDTTTNDGAVLGCVALRPLAKPGQCEGKRLYVLPAGRGLGVGRALLDAIIRLAVERGYENFWGDTLPSMKSALAMYEKMGMVPTEAYHGAFLEGTIFMKCDLKGLRGEVGAAKL